MTDLQAHSVPDICGGGRGGPGAELMRALARVDGFGDPDGPADPRGFARADHCDHVHREMDA